MKTTLYFTLIAFLTLTFLPLGIVQGSRPMVRLIYFLPNDRPARPERITALHQLVKDTQAFFADEMQRHGFGRKTFTIETNADGEPLVHQINGKFRNSYYRKQTIDKVWQELNNQFDTSQRIYFVAIDIRSERLSDGQACGMAKGFNEQRGKGFLIPASGHCFNVFTAAHELGHAFGLEHDFRNDAYIMSYGSNRNSLSKCAAEWLAVHRFFNTDENISNAQINSDVRIQMHAPTAAPPNGIRLRFEFSNANRLHQAQLYLRPTLTDPSRDFKLDGCRLLDAQSNTIEFVTSELVDVSQDEVTLQVIDKQGGMTRRTFPINIAPILPAPQFVSIPDPNLAIAVRKALELGRNTRIPQRALQNLRELDARNVGISDLTGLEHATQLRLLGLGENNITDLSPLAGLTNLTYLRLGGNNITDLSPLERLANLTRLRLWENNITDISPVAGLTNLTSLALGGNNITDISPLERLTNLTWLQLWENNIADISPLVANTGLGVGDEVELNNNPLSSVSINTHIRALQEREVIVESNAVIVKVVEPVNIPDANLRAAIELHLGKASGAPITVDEMAGLTGLFASESDISDLTGLEHATNLTELGLGENNITDISPLSGLTYLTYLSLSNNSISDFSSVAGLTNLTRLDLDNNTISNISPVAGLTNLTSLFLYDNTISDLSPLAALTNLTSLRLWNNSISDLSPLVDLTRLEWLDLSDNAISDISLVTGLTNLIGLGFYNNVISDISPLVANTGLGSGDTIDVSVNPLNYASIHTYIPELQSRGVEVQFVNLKPVILEYLLSIPAGISLIHVPLKVTAVDGVAKTIESISDLYDALGGASTVIFLMTFNSQTQEWASYFNLSDKGTSVDKPLTDDMGILANMITPASIHLKGHPLGTNGNSTITLNQGLNFVGLPLRDARIERVSDLFALDGIGDNVSVIILADNGEFRSVGWAGDPGDIPITGGQSFILTAQTAATVSVSGDGWTNVSGTAAAPPMLTGVQVGNTTPVLALRGSIVDEETGKMIDSFRVIVKNLSTGKTVTTVTTPDEEDYRLTVVDIETMRVATVGDTLEIKAQFPNPFIGVEPLRYTVTAKDVKQGWIQLPALVVYEIPIETELLRNYPNPFNPETWIPYRLAEDAFVTLTIYDRSGRVVRTLDVGHRIAAVYESQSKAIYWDGRNEVGEQVASSLYFYHLSAGDYSATRRMVIVK